MMNDETRNTNTKGFLSEVGMTEHGAKGSLGKLEMTEDVSSK
jgi:hypothetical protein